MNIKAKVVNPLLLLVTSVLFLGIGIFILIDHDLACLLYTSRCV